MKVVLALAAAVLAVAALPAQAVVFTAALSGANEVPAVVSPGMGTATVTLDVDAATLRVQASFSGLSSNTVGAHIHCCTATPNTANIGVATSVPAFAGFPLGVTAGSYDQTLDLMAMASYNPAFITGNGGTVETAFAALTGGLAAGQTYFNIHTAQFPAGELRGTLVAAIPEPETYALFVAGLAVLAGVSRRRRAKAVAA